MAKRLKVSSYLVSWFQCLTKLKYFEIANRFILFILDKPVKLSYFYSIMENEQEWINYFINERIIPFPESIPDSFFTKKERIILFNKIVENAEDREEMNNYLKSIDYVIAVKQGFNNEDVRESTLNVI